MQSFAENHALVYCSQTEIKEALRLLNEKVNGCGLYFRPDVDDNGYTAYPSAEVPPGTLLVLASFDFSYYHQLEIAFHGVQSHDIEDEDLWSDHWTKDQLVLMDSDAETGLHTFQFNIGSHSRYQRTIRSKGFSVAFCTVFYYDRTAQESLKEGERVAYWITRRT